LASFGRIIQKVTLENKATKSKDLEEAAEIKTPEEAELAAEGAEGSAAVARSEN
jgi:hypothetical protein